MKKYVIDNSDKRKRLIKECDKLASELCLKRDEYTCRYCGRKGNTAHHIFSRKFASLRWDLNNLLTLCPGCHRYQAHGYGIHTFIDWLKENVKYELLKIQKNNYFKTDINNLKLMKIKLGGIKNDVQYDRMQNAWPTNRCRL